MEGSRRPESRKHESKSKGSNVSGVEHAFKATGDGSRIQGEQAIINAGLGAGNPNFTALPIPVEGGGVHNAFNANFGGEINLNGATVNAGAFAGGSMVPRHITIQHNAPSASRTASPGYASGSYSKKHVGDKGN